MKIIVLILLISTTQYIFACKEQKGHRPPPEAFLACEGRQLNDVVTLTIRSGDKINAICKSIQDKLVAVPNDSSKMSFKKRKSQ